ncbi:eukaryotic translation initiation factor 4E, partial [Mortierella sp. NVP85]
MAQNDNLAVPSGDKYITVFNDPVNFNVKHPLHNPWTLWFDNPPKKSNEKNWEQSLKELITIDTVEDFWG